MKEVDEGESDAVVWSGDCEALKFWEHLWIRCWDLDWDLRFVGYRVLGRNLVGGQSLSACGGLQSFLPPHHLSFCFSEHLGDYKRENTRLDPSMPGHTAHSDRWKGHDSDCFNITDWIS